MICRLAFSPNLKFLLPGIQLEEGIAAQRVKGNEMALTREVTGLAGASRHIRRGAAVRNNHSAIVLAGAESERIGRSRCVIWTGGAELQDRSERNSPRETRNATDGHMVALVIERRSPFER